MNNLLITIVSTADPPYRGVGVYTAAGLHRNTIARQQPSW